MQLNKHELLKYLKSASDRRWLWYDANHGGSDRLLDQSVALERLIEVRLQQITFCKKSYSRTIVLIAETNPIAFLATFIAGAVAQVDLLLCDPSWQRREWEQVLRLVKPDLIYGDRATRELIAQIECLQSVEQSELPSESLILIPTGGTSGKIRFAMHTWETLTASVLSFQKYFGCQHINSCCTLPLYHVSGLMQFMRSFITQGNLVICSYKALQTRQLFIDKSNYFISLVPTQLQYSVASIPEWLSEFKTVLLGGAPPRRSLLDTARKYHIPVALTYGMTETASGVVTLKPQDFLAGNNSNGRVLPHANIKIVKDSQSQEKLVRADFEDNLGLVEINCSSLCLGYYPGLFTTKETLITDDLGYLDRNGYLYLVGRNSQKIITGGENVFPTEVESAIYATGLVKDVCVIGISDRFWGQVVTAIYVPLESSHDLNLIQQKVRQQLAKYKQPKHWIEIDKIPRNDRGKINYQKLKEIATHKLSSI